MRQLSLATARTGADVALVRASGSIAADADHSTPILLPFSGQVTAVLVEAGQHVTAGQPLLRVASPELIDARNAIVTAQAQQSAAAEAVRIATANAVRQKAIYQTAGGALKDFSQAQNDLVAAQSTLRTANAAVMAARGRLAIFGRSPQELRAPASGGTPDSVYRAPVSGLIADRSVAPGQFVTAGNGTALLTITNPTHVWLVAQLTESDAASVQVGDHVTVTTPALPGRTFDAMIDNVGAALDPATHRLAVRATIANPDGALKPQMFASFVIQRHLADGKGVLVPASAVIHEGDTARVWVVAPSGMLYGRAVHTAGTEGGLTRVVQGLQEGQRVVSQGAIFVNEAGADQ